MSLHVSDGQIVFCSDDSDPKAIQAKVHATKPPEADQS